MFTVTIFDNLLQMGACAKEGRKGRLFVRKRLLSFSDGSLGISSLFWCDVFEGEVSKNLLKEEFRDFLVVLLAEDFSG